jgi:hypothetical protein
MAYFSNGTEGELYIEAVCQHCAHFNEGSCPVLLLHLAHNYAECNKPDSFLHVLIPRDGIRNQKCRLFYAKDAPRLCPCCQRQHDAAACGQGDMFQGGNVA